MTEGEPRELTQQLSRFPSEDHEGAAWLSVNVRFMSSAMEGICPLSEVPLGCAGMGTPGGSGSPVCPAPGWISSQVPSPLLPALTQCSGSG